MGTPIEAEAMRVVPTENFFIFLYIFFDLSDEKIVKLDYCRLPSRRKGLIAGPGGGWAGGRALPPAGSFNC